MRHTARYTKRKLKLLQQCINGSIQGLHIRPFLPHDILLRFLSHDSRRRHTTNSKSSILHNPISIQSDPKPRSDDSDIIILPLGLLISLSNLNLFTRKRDHNLCYDPIFRKCCCSV